jgi:hypothetical protein
MHTVYNKKVKRTRTTRRKSRMTIAIIGAILVTVGMAIVPALG